MTRPILFKPEGGWVGDVIPFERDGVFHLWYLFADRRRAADGAPAHGMPWHLVTTADFVTFIDHGEAVPSGGRDAQDFNVYTGSVVIDDDGTAHLFYTAQNPHFLGADGRPLQLVAHATGEDGLHSWAKHPELTFGAPDGYETGDWRDPFVFRDADGWRMLVAARHREGPDRRRGAIAQLTSTDLRRWTPTDPLWDPRRYVAHECPDLFQWGSWWYLVYSEFTDAFCTRYRIARSPDGPWMLPDGDDQIDSRAFYAAKSVQRDGRRFLVGWIATREGSSDDGAWEWAGTMSVLEAGQRQDGALTFRLPDELLASFTEEVDAGMPEAPLVLDADDRYADAVGSADLPDAFLLSAEVELSMGVEEAGLLLRSTADGGEAGALRLEPRRGRVVFDRWPRAITGTEQWQVSGDVPHMLERRCDLQPGRHQIDVLVDGEIIIAVIDRQMVLSTRLHRRAGERIGFFANGGSAELLSLSIRRRT